MLHPVIRISATQHIYTTFLEKCGKGESLRSATCLRTVVGGKQGHASCKISLL